MLRFPHHWTECWPRCPEVAGRCPGRSRRRQWRRRGQTPAWRWHRAPRQTLADWTEGEVYNSRCEVWCLPCTPSRSYWKPRSSWLAGAGQDQSSGPSWKSLSPYWIISNLNQTKFGTFRGVSPNTNYLKCKYINLHGSFQIVTKNQIDPRKSFLFLSGMISLYFLILQMCINSVSQEVFVCFWYKSDRMITVFVVLRSLISFHICRSGPDSPPASPLLSQTPSSGARWEETGAWPPVQPWAPRTSPHSSPPWEVLRETIKKIHKIDQKIKKKDFSKVWHKIHCFLWTFIMNKYHSYAF